MMQNDGVDFREDRDKPNGDAAAGDELMVRG